MDTIKKRRIVRNFVIGYLILQSLVFVWFGWFAPVHTETITVTHEAKEELSIFPDYKDVTIPYNIAPLNFRVNAEVDKCCAKIEADGVEVMACWGKQAVQFEPKAWKDMLLTYKGKSLRLSVFTKIGDAWTVWPSFSIKVSDRPIDSHLVYRLIEPGYEKWHIVGIYQRDLESFDDQPIIRNDMTGYNCMNCHSFCMGDPNQMMFHMRAANGGTYIIQDRKISKLNTKTKGTISNMTYPYWHPSGRYIVSSVNDIKQFFHSVKPKKMEVFDLESDVVVYDVQKKTILSKASLITKESYETFPSFSPDGKWLYFCSAPAQKMPENYNKIRYSLCRVAFDAEKGEIHLPIDTLVHSEQHSYTFPRISPNGRFLMYTETAYGQFPIWHTDAEIRMLDLESRENVDLTTLNSPDTDSYHSWNSQSDWVVISSRRENGLYTLPYISLIGNDGQPTKPFVLPQEDPDKYDYQLYSYNIPELIKGAVETSPYAIQEVAVKNKPEQVQFK